MRNADCGLIDRFVIAAAIVCASCSHARPTSMQSPLAAPRRVAPPEGAVLTFFPRNIDFESPLQCRSI
jgi:hypothetical protein